MQCVAVPVTISVLCVSLFGFWTAIVAGAAWTYTLVAWQWHRHRTVPVLLILGAIGLTARIVTVAVLGDGRIYFLQPVLTSGAVGMAFLGSAALGRPVVRSLAIDFWPDLQRVAQHHAVIPAFRGLTVVWGLTQLVHGLGTLILAVSLEPGQTLAVRAVAGPVLTAIAVACSVVWMWTALRGAGLLRRRRECRLAVEAPAALSGPA